jgi:hypothetical protein
MDHVQLGRSEVLTLSSECTAPQFAGISNAYQENVGYTKPCLDVDVHFSHRECM